MQPFRGGVSFVVRQAVGWTVYAVALLAATVLVVTSGNELPIYGAYSATGIVGLVGMVVLMLSISFFEDSYVHNPPLRLQVRASPTPACVRPSAPPFLRPPARPPVRTYIRTYAGHAPVRRLASPLSVLSLSLSLSAPTTHAPLARPLASRALTARTRTHTYTFPESSIIISLLLSDHLIIHRNIPSIVRSPDHPS